MSSNFRHSSKKAIVINAYVLTTCGLNTQCINYLYCERERHVLLRLCCQMSL